MSRDMRAGCIGAPTPARTRARCARMREDARDGGTTGDRSRGARGPRGHAGADACRRGPSPGGGARASYAGHPSYARRRACDERGAGRSGCEHSGDATHAVAGDLHDAGRLDDAEARAEDLERRRACAALAGPAGAAGRRGVVVGATGRANAGVRRVHRTAKCRGSAAARYAADQQRSDPRAAWARPGDRGGRGRDHVCTRRSQEPVGADGRHDSRT